MKSKNIKNTSEIVNLNNDNNKKPNVNVNTYMKKSKRNSNKENIEITPKIIPAEIIPEIIIENVNQDIKPNVKALNLVKARLARKTHLVNKNTDREQKILNLVNEFQQDEYLKLQNKTEKLKNKLMKLI